MLHSNLQGCFLDARFMRAKAVWRVVAGPAIAVLATLARISWRAVSASEWFDDIGESLFLERDSSATIAIAIRDSVRIWHHAWIRAHTPSAKPSRGVYSTFFADFLRKPSLKTKWSARLSKRSFDRRAAVAG